MIFIMIPVSYNNNINKEGEPGSWGQGNPATPIPLGAGAGVVNDDEILAVAAAEREVPEREAHDDGDEHAAVERHDGEHEEVAVELHELESTVTVDIDRVQIGPDVGGAIAGGGEGSHGAEAEPRRLT